MNQISPPLDFLSGPALSSALENEKRKRVRLEVNLSGRLAYGGLNPGLLGCDVLDLSETGACVETHAPIDDLPEYLSIDFADIYCRARRCWTRGNQIGLEFIFD